ncbi:MAG: hypothetical protein GY821_00980 [Gammaproteobacteria bacterium]|nr:hypothetical protein [Gammaproteobacteria bacterium]
MERLLALINVIPPSERMFYSIKYSKQKFHKKEKIFFSGSFHRLGIYKRKKETDELFILPATIQLAIKIAERDSTVACMAPIAIGSYKGYDLFLM